MKYTIEDLKKKVNENGKVKVGFFDDIDDIDFVEELEPTDALKELNENYDCYLA